MEQLFTYNIILAFGTGLSLGFILGLACSNFVRHTSLVPLLNAVIVIVFLALNVYGVVYAKEIPYIFNFILATAFGGICGIDVVKYIKLLPGKKE